MSYHIPAIACDCTAYPQNLYVEALTANEIIFRDRTFKETIKVKGGHKGGALSGKD